jgi:ABC-2 type transport system ATP-binding protein
MTDAGEPMTDAAEPMAAAGSRVGDGQLVRTRDLTKQYGEFVAVDRLTFAVQAGEIYGLLGPNGAGKTTTILMLLGLSEPTSGEVRVLGLDPARNPLEVKRHVGYLPDSVGFYGRLTGRENLDYTARLSGIPADAAATEIDALLAKVGLAEAADNPADTYSRGMLQRLGIADALVKDPEVLILDEPTASIDPAGVAELLALIRSLAVERRLAVLLSSHLLSQVEQLCDRVGIFSRGRLVAEGTVVELSERAGGHGLALDEIYRRLATAAEADDGRAA